MAGVGEDWGALRFGPVWADEQGATGRATYRPYVLCQWRFHSSHIISALHVHATAQHGGVMSFWLHSDTGDVQLVGAQPFHEQRVDVEATVWA